VSKFFSFPKPNKKETEEDLNSDDDEKAVF